MAFSTTKLMTLTFLLQLTTENAINSTSVGNKICAHAEIQLFENEYCKGVVNSTVIELEPDVSKALEICRDSMEKFKQVLEYEELLLCKEIQTCLYHIFSLIAVCEDVIKNVIPPEFNYSISVEQELADDICSPAEIQRLENKFCSGLPNKTVLENEHDVTKTLEICLDSIWLNEVSEYKELPPCEEIKDCLVDTITLIQFCEDLVYSILPPELNNSVSMDQNLAEIKATYKIMYEILFIFLGILFIVGSTTNGLLLFIFVRHKRARNDVMLINLTVADILILAINMLVVCVLKSHQFKALSYIFSFCFHNFVFVSEYSLVIISFERFRAVFIQTEMRKDKRFPDWVKITCLWVLGSLHGILHASLVIINNDNRKILYGLRMWSIQFWLITAIEGILPIILIILFSLLASNRLKKLAKNFPGERSHYVSRIQDRYLAAKTLIVLAALFLISCMPQQIVRLVVIYYASNLKSLYMNYHLNYSTWLWVKIFTYTTMFLTSAINPVLLYFLSSKFRKYFKYYLCCTTRDTLDTIYMNQPAIGYKNNT